MATLTINGTGFEYIEKGTGTPVLFVHGGVSDYRVWRYQMDPFAEHYRAIAYSRRYHHPNPWQGDGSDYSVTLHAKDLAGFIHALNVGKVHLVGNSYGAYTSLLTAMDHPDLVRTLTLNEPPVLPLLVSNPDNPLQILSLFLKDPSTAKSFMHFGMKHFKPAAVALKKGQLEEGVRLFADGALGDGRYDKISDKGRAAMLENAAALRAELLGPGFPPFPKDKVAGLHIPALFVFGQYSPKFLVGISNMLAKLLPGSEKVTIPGASHLTHWENPEAYNQKVLDFLSRHP